LRYRVAKPIRLLDLFHWLRLASLAEGAGGEKRNSLANNPSCRKYS
jgi:hypothetical protein